MIALLNTLGPAIWRATWQAAILAVLVAIVVRCFGERLAPRWKFLLWGVVLTRLLFVWTPSSPWSAFNLVHWDSEPHTSSIVRREDGTTRTQVPQYSDSTSDITEAIIESPPIPGPAPESSVTQVSAPPGTPPDSYANRMASTSSVRFFSDRVAIVRAFLSIWLAGCLLFGLKLLATALVLRRRLSACRPVSDATLLKLLETTRQRIGLRRCPALLVTPECISPCTVGTWNPRIVLPESVVTESSTARLRHVLAHELAHLVRGDLWTNWLLLAARILHWFNPVAWWTVREMQTEREAACDELAFAALGDADRSAYAATIVELAARLAPSGIAPGLIGLFSSTCRLRSRVERLLRSPSVTTLRTPFAAGLLLATALLGLTDAMPGAQAQAPEDAAVAEETEPTANTHTVTGLCVEDADRTPLAGVTVRLYRVEGRTSLPVEIARTVTDEDGRYTFTGLLPPRRGSRDDRLEYGALGFAADRPIGISFFHIRDDEEVVELRMAHEMDTLSGLVVDADLQPVVGATVMPYFVYDRPVPDLLSARTDADGRFEIDNLGIYKWPNGKPVPTSFVIRHPNYPETRGKAEELPAEVVITLPAGCRVSGTVFDSIAGKPAAKATITARRLDEWGETFATTNKAGDFRMVVPEGRYSFLVTANDRVCIAVTDRECIAGEKLELPQLKLIGGGFIAGRVVNTSTGESVSISERGEPITLGLFGPSNPVGKVVTQTPMAEVDETGRFVLRAAPGENFPYFVNTRGERMAWNTRRQPPVVVKDGELTIYNMLITLPVPTEEKLKAARELIAALPKQPTERTKQIVAEFRKLSHTVDETELWCSLMRELVAIGPEAVPQLCAELDRTVDNLTVRRLAFALRAIGDPRAVPSLIRAIPRTLLPGSSDFGLIVDDKELAGFMQTHDLGNAGGTYFNYGRPVREVFGTLHRLTGQSFDDAELFGISLSEDPRRQVLQRRIYRRQARRWQAWWEDNAKDFTDDAAYQTVDLKVVEEPLPVAVHTLGPNARLGRGMTGAILSPAIEAGQHTRRAYDLDTGHRPNWPTEIPKGEASRDAKKLEEWASQSGVDLICVTYHSPDGTATYVLQALGMKVQEIDARDIRNLDRLIAAGTLPKGRPVGELLMHYNPNTKQYMPDADAAFLFVTREGTMGVIETTDRVTRTENLTGNAYGPPTGVGFHKGVRFNLKEIVP